MDSLGFLTSFIGLTENPVLDWIIGGIMLSLSGRIAYKIGGELGYGGKSGFILWLITGFFVYAVLALIFKLVLWIMSIPWWIWVAVVSVVVLIIIVTIIIVRRWR